MSEQLENTTLKLQPSLAEVSPAKTYRSPENVAGCSHLAPGCSSRLRELLENSNLAGSFWRMCRDCFPQTRVRTSKRSLKRLPTSGMAWHGEYWTANFSESLSVAVVCTLSAVLEDRAPQRFFLSQRAAAGILRRAKNRGRMLPPRLQVVLEGLAAGERTTDIMDEAVREETGATILFATPSKDLGMEDQMTTPPKEIISSSKTFVEEPETERILGRESELKKAGLPIHSAKPSSTPLPSTGRKIGASEQTNEPQIPSESNKQKPLPSTSSEEVKHPASRRHAYKTDRTGTIQSKGNAASGNEAGTVISTEVDPDRMRDSTRLPQGLDDSKFPLLPKGLDSARYRALGNAVTVQVAEWVARRIRQATELG